METRATVTTVMRPWEAAGVAYTNAAKEVLQRCERSGGVVYFPPGRYSVKGNVTLVDGVVLRGESTGTDAAVGGKAGK